MRRSPWRRRQKNCQLLSTSFNFFYPEIERPSAQAPTVPVTDWRRSAWKFKNNPETGPFLQSSEVKSAGLRESPQIIISLFQNCCRLYLHWLNFHLTLQLCCASDFQNYCSWWLFISEGNNRSLAVDLFWGKDASKNPNVTRGKSPHTYWKWVPFWLIFTSTEDQSDVFFTPTFYFEPVWIIWALQRANKFLPRLHFWGSQNILKTQCYLIFYALWKMRLAVRNSLKKVTLESLCF